MTLMADSIAELERIISCFNLVTSSFGLKVIASKSCYLVNNFSALPVSERPLNVSAPSGPMAIPYERKAMFLGFGLKAHKTLNLADHLSMRDELRAKVEHTKKVKRLR